jgi:hypothetical protein
MLGIHSPSTVFAGLAENMNEGMIVGLDRTKAKVTRAVAQVASDVVVTGQVAKSAGAAQMRVSGQEPIVHEHYVMGDVTISAKDLAEVQSMRDLFETLRQKARAAGGTSTMRTVTA